jgi:hypothetical protein
LLPVKLYTFDIHNAITRRLVGICRCLEDNLKEFPLSSSIYFSNYTSKILVFVQDNQHLCNPFRERNIGQYVSYTRYNTNLVAFSNKGINRFFKISILELEVGITIFSLCPEEKSNQLGQTSAVFLPYCDTVQYPDGQPPEMKCFHQFYYN